MQSRNPAIQQKLKFPSPAKLGFFLRKYKLPVLLVFLHAPLGVLLMPNPGLAVVHAYAVLVLGFFWAIKKQIPLGKVAVVVAYLVGSEVLWRMTHADIYWEFGKYAAGFIMLTALVFRDKWKIPTLPIIYFVLLLPACFLTVMNNNFAEAKDKLSFNMSGPFLLFIACWFFSHIKINWFQLRKILFWLIVPLVSVAFTTLIYTVSVEDITFNAESNYQTSGGFGPNQVSAMLGLGTFICTACYLLFKNNLKEKLTFGLLVLFLAMQSIMTFSRGGIYNAGGAILAILVFQMRDAKKGIKHILSVAIIVAIFMIAIFPQLNDFTDGALRNRFESTETTGRTEIVEADIQIFLDNPVWGVGVGESFDYHERYFKKKVAAHTEFSRLISEHGIFGVFSLLVLMLMGFFVIKRQKTTLGKAAAAGFVAWSGFFMINTGMRLVAPSFVWGLSFIILSGLSIRSKRLSRPVLIPKNEFEKQTE